MRRHLLQYHVKRIPNCTNYDEFWEWRKLANASLPPYSTWFCTDCTKEFQSKMIKENKCDHPYISFKLVHGDIEGYVSKQDDDTHNKVVSKLNGVSHEPE